MKQKTLTQSYNGNCAKHTGTQSKSEYS